MRPFQFQDLKVVDGWLDQHGHTPINLKILPPTGLIVEGVACGFLIYCDNGIGILDFFVTNPEASIRSRYAAVDQLTGRLIEIAKKSGLRMISCDCKRTGTARIARKHGLYKIGSFEAYLGGI